MSGRGWWLPRAIATPTLFRRRAHAYTHADDSRSQRRGNGAALHWGEMPTKTFAQPHLRECLGHATRHARNVQHLPDSHLPQITNKPLRRHAEVVDDRVTALVQPILASGAVIDVRRTYTAGGTSRAAASWEGGR